MPACLTKFCCFYRNNSTLERPHPVFSDSFLVDLADIIRQPDHLQQSIDSLTQKVQSVAGGSYKSRLHIIFMSNTNLPLELTSLDVWVLRGQNVAITKFTEVLDQMLHLTFTTLTLKIREKFGQTITPRQ